MVSVEARPLRMTVMSAPARTVHPDDAGLHGRAVANLGNVPDVDGRSVDDLDRQLVQLGDGSSGCCSGWI